jgi:hypothetical protein
VWRGSARDSHGRTPIVYAPSQFERGSSLCHLDDNAYPQGDPDALMTSLIRRGEVIHRIGPAALGVLHDLGWVVRAEPASVGRAVAPPARAAVTSSTSTSVSVQPPPTTAAPVPVANPSRAVRRTAAVGDFGRTGAFGVEALIPMLVVALVWCWRRRSFS